MNFFNPGNQLPWIFVIAGMSLPLVYWGLKHAHRALVTVINLSKNKEKVGQSQLIGSNGAKIRWHKGECYLLSTFQQHEVQFALTYETTQQQTKFLSQNFFSAVYPK